MRGTAKATLAIAVMVAIAAVVLGVAWWSLRELELPVPPPMTTFVAATPGRIGPPDIQRRVFLDVNQAPAPQVFKRLSDTIACKLDLDAGLQDRVTLRVSNITAATALHAICESIGCRWELKGETLLVTRTAPPPPVPEGEAIAQKLRAPLPDDLRFADVPARDAVQAIARASAIDIDVEGWSLDKRITVDVGGDNPVAALFKVLQAAGLRSDRGFAGGVSTSVNAKNGTVRVHVVVAKPS